MKEPIWIDVADAELIHDAELVVHGGSQGIRDHGLLESALMRARNLWTYDSSRPSLQRLAAAYAFGISANHPFVDGSKRTALVISFAFCEVNGLEVTASQEDAYLAFMALAAGQMSEQQLTDWLEHNTRA